MLYGFVPKRTTISTGDDIVNSCVEVIQSKQILSRSPTFWHRTIVNDLSSTKSSGEVFVIEF